MLDHEFLNGICKWCGAMTPGTNCSCLDGKERIKLKPEPSLKLTIMNDIDFIHNRILELKNEKENIIINHIDEE